MLAAWLKKAHLKEGEEKGRAERRALILEALRNMQPDETVEDAIARLEKEQGKSDNPKG